MQFLALEFYIDNKNRLTIKFFFNLGRKIFRKNSDKHFEFSIKFDSSKWTQMKIFVLKFYTYDKIEQI